jgi:hypothetical protein
MIEERTIFTTRGHDFPTLAAAESYRQDLIGNWLDRILGARIDRAQALRLVEYMVKDRDQLRTLLDY